MAKNLYNLTAVTTVNDSDLLHVNQGSVSSDKKVTKQNLLKEVNSSISSINNSLANIGTRAALFYTQTAVTATMAYVGLSFSLTKRSIVRVTLYYTNSRPSALAIGDSNTGSNVNFLASVGVVPEVTNSAIAVSAVLDAGTYYIYARSATSAQNTIGAVSYQIEP